MSPSPARDAAIDPPAIVRLAAHPVRWRLLRELVHSDHQVRELTHLVGEPQNLVSYHLRHLRNGGLVSARRSAADARESYYAIDLEGCRRQMQAAAGALHPALSYGPPPPATGPVTPAGRRRHVLFLCTGNSARSQIAEALLVHLSQGTVDAASAGSHPKALHPNAVRVLKRRGIDIGANRTKHLDEVRARRFDVVITLCDRVREVCPELPGHPDLVHWSMADPAAGGATDRSTYPAFERTATELELRIAYLLAQLTDPPKRRSAHAPR